MRASASKSGALSAAAAVLTRGPAVVSILCLVACASAPTDPEARAEYERANDPAEPTNRTIFAGNQFVDRNALRPVARAYDDYVPSGVRTRLHNFVSNLKEPGIAVNDTLQANFSRAWNPSVQLPLFGPSNVRDAVGKAVSFVANPLGFIPGGTMSTIDLAGTGVGAVDGRADLLSVTDKLEQTSVDYYATLRSIEAQRRAAFIEEGKAGGEQGRVNIGPLTPVPDVTLPATP
jgi:phospholipid-binding lipoprotein MlaA